MANPTSRGQQRDKPVRDALRMESKALENGERLDHPEGSLRWNAQRLLMLGDASAFREIADRLDGKVPQAIVGDSEYDPLAISQIERVIVDPKPSDPNRKSVPAASGSGEV